MQLDALAFAAHADDIELSCSGTIIKLGDMGYKTGVVVLTHGEMGTLGTPETREAEFEEACRLMGVAAQRLLDIPDSDVQVTRQNKLKLIKIIRELRPRVVFAPYWKVRHPDHGHCSDLVREAAFFAGLKKIDTAQEPHRPNKVIYYPCRYEFTPSFIVDISTTFERKLQAIAAYKSQFHHPDMPDEGAERFFMNSPEFLEIITTRAKYWGSHVGVRYGEPFLVREPLKIDDPVKQFEEETFL